MGKESVNEQALIHGIADLSRQTLCSICTEMDLHIDISSASVQALRACVAHHLSCNVRRREAAEWHWLATMRRLLPLVCTFVAVLLVSNSPDLMYQYLGIPPSTKSQLSKLVWVVLVAFYCHLLLQLSLLDVSHAGVHNRMVCRGCGTMTAGMDELVHSKIDPASVTLRRHATDGESTVAVELKMRTVWTLLTAWLRRTRNQHDELGSLATIVSVKTQGGHVESSFTCGRCSPFKANGDTRMAQPMIECATSPEELDRAVSIIESTAAVTQPLDEHCVTGNDGGADGIAESDDTALVNATVSNDRAAATDTSAPSPLTQPQHDTARLGPDLEKVLSDAAKTGRPVLTAFMNKFAIEPKPPGDNKLLPEYMDVELGDSPRLTLHANAIRDGRTKFSFDSMVLADREDSRRHFTEGIRSVISDFIAAGTNVTLMSDGVTGAGKTVLFTKGPESVCAIVASTIFKTAPPSTKVLLQVVEVYGGKARELHRGTKKEPNAYLTTMKLEQWPVQGCLVDNAEDLLTQIRTLSRQRHTSATEAHKHSSRGSMVIRLSLPEKPGWGDLLILELPGAEGREDSPGRPLQADLDIQISRTEIHRLIGELSEAGTNGATHPLSKLFRGAMLRGKHELPLVWVVLCVNRSDKALGLLRPLLSEWEFISSGRKVKTR